jgi:hypothetical protein
LKVMAAAEAELATAEEVAVVEMVEVCSPL